MHLSTFWRAPTHFIALDYDLIPTWWLSYCTVFSATLCRQRTCPAHTLRAAAPHGLAIHRPFPLSLSTELYAQLLVHCPSIPTRVVHVARSQVSTIRSALPVQHLIKFRLFLQHLARPALPPIRASGPRFKSANSTSPHNNMMSSSLYAGARPEQYMDHAFPRLCVSSGTSAGARREHSTKSPCSIYTRNSLVKSHNSYLQCYASSETAYSLVWQLQLHTDLNKGSIT